MTTRTLLLIAVLACCGCESCPQGCGGERGTECEAAFCQCAEGKCGCEGRDLETIVTPNGYKVRRYEFKQ